MLSMFYDLGVLMNRIIFETCCGSADDCIQSELGGADRAELNSALFLGGLTPSLAELDTALRHTSHLEIVTMVRPRHGGFHYTDIEFETMLHDAGHLLSHGSEGIVFGFLHADGTVDVERCQRMIDMVGSKQAIFHRAFDVVPDWRTAMDQLVDLGVCRILTSGQRCNAYEGRENLRQMIEYAAGRIEILPGAGLREHNVMEVIRHTGCSQVHMSKRRACLDLSVECNPEICFGNPASPEEYSYEMIDGDGLRKAIDDVRKACAED